MLVLLDREQFDELLARRRAWGADKLDEVWKGVPHLGQQVGRRVLLQPQPALLLGGAAEERAPVGSDIGRESPTIVLASAPSSRPAGALALDAVIAADDRGAAGERAERSNRRNASPLGCEPFRGRA
jgi:hypothetical protein